MLQKAAAKSGRAFDAKQSGVEEEEESGNVGRVKESSRAYFKEFKKVVDAADVVLEVCHGVLTILIYCRSWMHVIPLLAVAHVWSKLFLLRVAAKSLCWCLTRLILFHVRLWRSGWSTCATSFPRLHSRLPPR